MCGLFGFINLSGVNSARAEAAFKQLMVVDQLRGSDACGAALMNLNGGTDWVKAAVMPHEFLEMPRSKQFFGKPSTFSWIGHNRAKTFGPNTHDNAHPFEEGHILGAHNGTIRNKYALCENGHNVDVDSQALFRGIATKGVKETLKNADGAYSIVYFDTKEKTINFARNDERPMVFVEAQEIVPANSKWEGPKFIFFGSEFGMLAWILQRNGFKLGEYKVSTPLTHYTFKIGEEKPSIFQLEKYTYVYQGRGNGGRWNRGEWLGYGEEEVEKPVVGAAKQGPILLTAPKTTTIETDETPVELRDFPYLKDKTVPAQRRKTLSRVWRDLKRDAPVNFIIEDFVDLGDSAYQVSGQLAGKNKRDLPVYVTTLVDKRWMNEVWDIQEDATVYRGVVTGRGRSPDGKMLVIYCRDPVKLNIDTLAEESNVAC